MVTPILAGAGAVGWAATLLPPAWLSTWELNEAIRNMSLPTGLSGLAATGHNGAQPNPVGVHHNWPEPHVALKSTLSLEKYWCSLVATLTCEVGLTIRSRAILPEEARCYGLAPHVNWRATHMLEVHMVDRRFLVLPAVS